MAEAGAGNHNFQVLTLKNTAQRVFSLDDQIEFARLSGNWNPIHLDPVFARRTLAGQVVVHGIHAALWALDVWAIGVQKRIQFRTFRASFVRPMPVSAALTVSVAREHENSVKVDVLCGSSLGATIEADWVSDDHRAVATTVDTGLPPRTEPVERSVDAIAGCAGAFPLRFDARIAGVLFPALAVAVPDEQLASLASTSRIVGVECPGLHSLLFEADLVARSGVVSSDVGYRVGHVDARFGLVRLQIETPAFTGTVGALLRPKPIAQATCAAVRKEVQQSEFAGVTALIVGGSRGLGEVAAKILASGGADVTLTYHRGETDAARVVSDIVASGGIARSMPLDVLDGRHGLADSLRPDFLYYFASPFIVSGTREQFSPELLTQFCAYYLAGFERIVETLASRGLRQIFYPSSVLIDDMPLEMREYVIAKAAGETLCAFLERRFPGLHIVRPRLPRMATDQTAAQRPVKNADPLPVILREIRAFHGRAG